jgi:hypothetical protein
MPNGAKPRPAAPRLPLWAARGASGELAEIAVLVVGADWFVAAEDGVLALPDGALAAVIRRYGRPLDRPAPPVGDELELSDERGLRVRAFDFMRFGDVLPQRYVLASGQSDEPLAAPAPLVAAALVALARASATAAPGDPG